MYIQFFVNFDAYSLYQVDMKKSDYIIYTDGNSQFDKK